MNISLDTLPKMQEIAAGAGIGFTIEPHTGSLLVTPDTVLAMLKELPGLTLSLDYSHFIGAGFKPEELLPLHPYAKP
jgi:sugar phosphate isomerase/epimerase